MGTELEESVVAVLRAHALIGNRRKECTCGWHQNSYGTTELNHPHHVAGMLWQSDLLADGPALRPAVRVDDEPRQD